MTLTLRSGDPAVAIDRMDISGSWAVVSVSGDAFPQENDTTSKDFYVGDRRLDAILLLSPQDAQRQRAFHPHSQVEGSKADAYCENGRGGFAPAVFTSTI